MPSARVVEERVVAVEAQPDPPLRAPARMGLVERDDLEQLRLQAPADQVPLQALDRRQAVLHPRSRRVEERVRAVEEDPAVLLAGLVEDVHVVAEILLHDGLRVAAAPAGRDVGVEPACDLLDRAQPVKQHGQLGAAVGDRARAVLALAVEVHGLGQHVDGAGHEVGGDDDGDVLVEHADGEREPVLVPERAAPQLVLRHPVAQQPREARDVRRPPRREKARLRKAAGHGGCCRSGGCSPSRSRSPCGPATRPGARSPRAGARRRSRRTSAARRPRGRRPRCAPRRGPAFSWRTRTKRGSAAATRPAIAAELSGEPSSIITTSRSPNVCARSNARHSPR